MGHLTHRWFRPMELCWHGMKGGLTSFFRVGFKTVCVCLSHRGPHFFGGWGKAGSNRWPLDCRNFTFSGMCIMHSFFRKFGSKTSPKTGNIFPYFLDNICCFNRNDCIPYFLLYKRLNQMPIWERGFLRNHSNSGRFGNYTSSKPVISFLGCHRKCKEKGKQNLWFRNSCAHSFLPNHALPFKPDSKSWGIVFLL